LSSKVLRLSRRPSIYLVFFALEEDEDDVKADSCRLLCVDVPSVLLSDGELALSAVEEGGTCAVFGHCFGALWRSSEEFFHPFVDDVGVSEDADRRQWLSVDSSNTRGSLIAARREVSLCQRRLVNVGDADCERYRVVVVAL
jgi:hypothetical protein